jgi:hypothetical protein
MFSTFNAVAETKKMLTLTEAYLCAGSTTVSQLDGPDPIKGALLLP